MLHKEITTNIPPEIMERYQDRLSPVFLAYGCVLLEGFTGMVHVYKVVNLETGDRTHLCQLPARLTPSCYGQIAERIRLCDVADTGAMEADARLGRRVGRDKLAAIQTAIFSELLPAHGYGVRSQQIELADHILEALCRRNITLAEAEVGTGKTHAYLTAAALVKRGRINDLWIKGSYPGIAYITSMPVVVSTSSIALQNAIIRDYIPEISRILLEHGVINTPLTCVLRKGREHYLCEKRLRNYLRYVRNPHTKELLTSLMDKQSGFDLGEMSTLTPYLKSKIGVTGRCGQDCSYFRSCRYLVFMRDAQSDQYDFQVCNHNYMLADLLRRGDGQSPLIPHYQAVVVDEAHKLLDAARQMYGLEFSDDALPRIGADIRGFTFRKGESGSKTWRLSKKMIAQSEWLFHRLNAKLPDAELDEEAERFPAAMDESTTLQLGRIIATIDTLLAELSERQVNTRYKGRCAQVLWEMGRLRELAAALEQHRNLVCFLEKRGDGLALCAIPKQLGERLRWNLWSKGIPIVLTSGTLSAAGDFSRVKDTLGLHRLPNGGCLPPSRLMETRKPSPFDHNANTLLYVSETVPFPDSQDKQYLTAVADEVERLVRASHGHATVLFTSYKAMDMVREMLETRCLPFPLFPMHRGKTDIIQRFKESCNGVLLASGALWEGIDIPGDTLSMLIIVKLPFPVPDPISEYERTLYPSMDTYKSSVIIPDMLVKLRQGFGRLIRTGTDSGVVALLDSRVRQGGAYRERALRALPRCRVTGEIGEVSAFLQGKKEPGYFA